MNKLDQVATFLQLSDIDSWPQLKELQQKTSIKPSILVILVFAFLLLLSIFIDLSPLILTVVAVIIPAYMTFHVIGTKVEREYIRFIIYWISFGLMELLIQPIVTLVFGPFFLIILETVLVVALIHPKFNMSLILYDRVIKMYVLKEENGLKKVEQHKENSQQEEAGKEKVGKEEQLISVSPVKQEE